MNTLRISSCFQRMAIHTTTLCVLLLYSLALYAAAAWHDPAFAQKQTGKQELGLSLSLPSNSGKEIRVTFTEPMIPQQQVGSFLVGDALPFTCSLGTGWQGQWLDAATLEMRVSQALPFATVVSLQSKAGIQSLRGVPLPEQTWSIVARPLALQKSVAQTRYTADGLVSYELAFTSQVDLASLKKHLQLTDAHETAVPFTLTSADNTPAQTFSLSFRPKELGLHTLSISQHLKSTAGSAPLGTDIHLRLMPTSMLQITTLKPQQALLPPWKRFISLTTTLPVKPSVLEQHLVLSPNVPFSITSTSPTTYSIEGDFEALEKLAITVQKGLPSLDGAGLLAAPFTENILFPAAQPAIFLGTQGTLATPGQSTRIPLSTMNVDAVNITLYELPENSIPLAAMDMFYNYRANFAQKVMTKQATIAHTPDSVANHSIDIAELAGTKRGVFYLTVTDANSSKKVSSALQNQWFDNNLQDKQPPYHISPENNQKSQKVVLLSDIGLTAQKRPGSVSVWANSLSKGKPVAGCTIRLYSNSNLLLAEGSTDARGLWEAQLDTQAGKRAPAIVVASLAATRTQEKDTSYLLLSSPLLQDELRDFSARMYHTTGYEAFVYTPRDIYRPGESVPMQVLVRTPEQNAPQPMPLSWRLECRGRLIDEGTIQLSATGNATFSLPLSSNAALASYSVYISIPGDKRIPPLAVAHFEVADMQPPRLHVALTPKQQPTVGPEPIGLGIQAKYLFGTAAAKLPWEATLRSEAYLSFSHSDWKAFIFPPAQIDQPYRWLPEQKGTLDDHGMGQLSIDPQVLPPVPQTLSIEVGVQEDGGRFVYQTRRIAYYPFPVVLGFAKTEQAFAATENYSLQVAAVTPTGTPATTKTLQWSIARINTYYARTEQGFMQHKEYKELTESPVQLTKGIGTVHFSFDKEGEYRLLLRDPQTGATAEQTVTVWPGTAMTKNGASPLLDKVLLSWDKERYLPKDTARLRIRAPFAGQLLLTIESTTTHHHQLITMKEAEMTVSIPISAAMGPYSYCTVWALRPMQAQSPWGAYRAMGVIPLALDTTGQRITTEIMAPEQVEPKTDVSITVTLQDKQGKPVTGEVVVYLIDEGLLQLSRKASPDPFRFFSSLRSLATQLYDRYNELLPFTAWRPVQLAPGGGADESDFAPAIQRKVELLSLAGKTVTSDAKGKATVTFSLPEYNGQARIMAIASSPHATGSASRNISISRDIVVEPTLLRSTAPNDTFTMPITLFSRSQNPHTVNGTVQVEGPLELTGTSQYSLNFDTKTSQQTIYVPLKAQASAGIATVTMSTSIDGKAPFSKKIETVVRPAAAPVVLHSYGVVSSDSTTTLRINNPFMQGSQRVRLNFAPTIDVGITSAMDFLRSYPHGCLEQRTSATWPYLAAPTLLQRSYPDLATSDAFKGVLAQQVRALISMQQYSGGFAPWSHEQSIYPWGSVYATHLLTEMARMYPGSVPAPTIKDSLNYLANTLLREERPEAEHLSTRAYAAFVLARNQQAPLGWMQKLHEQQERLLPSGKIFLAGAFALAQGNTDPLRALGTKAYTERLYGSTLESPARNEALRLLMWVYADPFAPEAGMLAQRVLQQGQKGDWTNTQENGCALTALGLYAQKTATVSQTPAQATLFRNNADGTRHYIRTFPAKEPISFATEDLLDSTALAANGTDFGIEFTDAHNAPSTGTLYYALINTGTPEKIPAPTAKGINIAQRWILADGTSHDTFEQTKEQGVQQKAANIQVPFGEKVTVQLYMEASEEAQNMVISNLLPGGFEFESVSTGPVPNASNDSTAYAARLAQVQYNAPFPLLPPQDPGKGKETAQSALPAWMQNIAPDIRLLNGMPGVRAEMRDDRLIIYADTLPKRAVFTYTLRAVTQGTFTLPPASAEGMYDTGVNAVTMPGTVTVPPAK